MRFFVLSLMVLLASCTRTPPEIQAQIDKLTAKENVVKQELKGLEYQRDTLKKGTDSLKVLREEVRSLEVQKNGGEVEYVLECNLSQDRDNIMSSSNIKDMMNAVNFELVVDRRTYNHCKNGTELLRKSRKGSATTENSYSDWLIKVTGKHINYL